ncbi:MAG: glutamate--tRNA ligase [Rhodocyclaceae bacterium]|nr:glutamate--tRNA ligase [Rhodocyclaceae bacterium]
MSASTSVVKTRFAPSPTGYLHIGGARTALFSWAYARRHGGRFVLRIEDTDIARSTPDAVRAIFEGMRWLRLDPDEGPYFQTQRLWRYKEVIQQMLAAGTAYYCYMSKEELDALRAEQEARKEKPRYDGRWRPEPGKTLPTPPSGVQPVVRFKNPKTGKVGWQDLVKGWIEFDNAELDDFVIARADGTPTYNFCVVVDDWDMGITHVIRGDDHVNNTPRQINLLRALGAPVPAYGHLSMILGPDGAKLSKRHGAVSVMQYEEDGYLPEAVLNYLARLGWSHGDDEIFSMEQFVAWFDLDHITASAAQFNTEKLLWLNAHYLKQCDDERLAHEIRRRLAREGVIDTARPDAARIAALYKERVKTLNELADAAHPFYVPPHPSPELKAQHLTAEALAALNDLAQRLQCIEASEFSPEAVSAALKATLAARGLKMPQLAIPLRVVLLGQPQSPAIDRIVAVLGKEETLRRIETAGQ